MVDWSGAVSSHTRTTDASTAATAPSRDASLKRATAPVDDIMAPKGANDILAATTARRTRRRRGAASRNGARARPTRDGSIGRMDRRRRRASWERGCARVKRVGETTDDAWDVFAGVDTKKKVSTFVIDCAKPVRVKP